MNSLRFGPAVVLGLLIAGASAIPAAQGAARSSGPSIPDVQLPLSPSGQAAIQVGGSWTETGGSRRYADGRWIVVDYGRPLLRGRDNIFGTGADYGAVVEDGAPVWRAGANATTTITTQVPIVVGGTRLEPGVYNVFADLAAAVGRARSPPANGVGPDRRDGDDPDRAVMA